MLVTAAAMALLASCGVVEGSEPPESTTGDTLPAEFTELQAGAIDALVEAFGALETAGLVPYGASFDYRWCDRRELSYLGEAYGRFDTPRGGASTEADAVAARTALAELGWLPVDSDRWKDGLWISDNRWHLAMSRDGLGLAMAFFRTKPAILFKITGECVEVPTELEEHLSGFQPINLDELVGATGRADAAARASSAPPTG